METLSLPLSVLSLFIYMYEYAYIERYYICVSPVAAISFTLFSSFPISLYHHLSTTDRQRALLLEVEDGLLDAEIPLQQLGAMLSEFMMIQFSPHSTLLYSTLLYSTPLYSTLLYSTLLYSTLLYYTLLYSTVLYSTLLHSKL